MRSKRTQTLKERRNDLRQYMMENGLQGMPLVEVVELMLYYTIPRKDVRPIAQELVNRFGTLHRMIKASSRERKSIPGLTDLTDQHFAMMSMFIPYLFRKRLGEYPILDTIEKLKEFSMTIHLMDEYEVMYILCLNAGDRLIKKECRIGFGTPTQAHVELRHITDAVANTSTVKVVLTHNHPSGVTVPSDDDIELTKTIRNYLARINITLQDHLIVADNTVVSMRLLGLLK